MFPLVSEILNFRGFLILFINPYGGVILNYFNLVLITLGSIVQFRNKGVLSRTAKLWYVFYLFYFNFGILAMSLFSNYTPLIRTLIPILYFTGFYLFLSIEEHRKVFLKTATISFLVASILLIYFVIINFDLDKEGISQWKLDRPGGVYGDANNAALACILAYILFDHFFIAKTKIIKYIKILVLFIIFYSLFLTFSTTGMVGFILILIVSNLHYFNKHRIILLVLFGIVFFMIIINLESLTSSLDLTPGQRLKISNLVNIFSLNTEQVDNSGRAELLEHLFIYINKNPIIGNGLDFSVNIKGHNTLFGVWADAGIFTFILFIIVLIIFFKRSIQADINVKYFCLSMLIPICLFMMSLQTIINQPYLIVIFPYIGYLIDCNQNKIVNTF